MNNLKIIEDFKSQVLTDRNRYVLNFTKKHQKKMDNLLRRLEEGSMSDTECLRRSKISKPTFYAIKKIGEQAFNYFEERGIDYENTEFFDVIDSYLSIDQAYLIGTEKMINIIKKAAEDEFDEVVDEHGNSTKKLIKKGDWKAAEFILKNGRRREYRDIEEIEEVQKAPLVIIQTNGMDLQQLALMSQNNLINKIKDQE